MVAIPKMLNKAAVSSLGAKKHIVPKAAPPQETDKYGRPLKSKEYSESKQNLDQGPGPDRFGQFRNWG